ncbi:MAG: DUF433 domain-containing protein [Bryobacterales bacterium]|nr:DUF433 domain-containing protein [Bryobacterales bacterium]
MKDSELLERIVLDPEVMAGKPVIRGTRLTVEYVMGLLAHGASESEILEEYDGLSSEDIQACLLFAAKSLESVTFLPLAAKIA